MPRWKSREIYTISLTSIYAQYQLNFSWMQVSKSLYYSEFFEYLKFCNAIVNFLKFARLNISLLSLKKLTMRSLTYWSKIGLKYFALIMQSTIIRQLLISSGYISLCLKKFLFMTWTIGTYVLVAIVHRPSWLRYAITSKYVFKMSSGILKVQSDSVSSV